MRLDLFSKLVAFVRGQLSRNKRAAKHLPRRWLVALSWAYLVVGVHSLERPELRSYTVIATAWLQVPPVGRLAPPLTVMAAPVEGVRMSVKVEGPPQLIPITVRV